MIVVVEGPDGSGKSTLIDNLRFSCDKHYVALRRSGPPQDADEIVTVVNWMNRMSIGKVPLICDRHPLISEPIYGQALRGSNLLDGIYSVDDIKENFLDHVDRVIYCRPPTSVICRKMHDNQQLKGVVEKIDEITQKYDHTMKLLSFWGVIVLNYDWTDTHSQWNDPEWKQRLEALFFGRI
jgi:hypothetical protein